MKTFKLLLLLVYYLCLVFATIAVIQDRDYSKGCYFLLLAEMNRSSYYRLREETH